MLVDPVKHYFYIWLIHVRRDGRPPQYDAGTYRVNFSQT